MCLMRIRITGDGTPSGDHPSPTTYVSDLGKKDVINTRLVNPECVKVYKTFIRGVPLPEDLRCYELHVIN